MVGKVRLRQYQPGDRAFAEGLFASTRSAELAALPGSDDQRQAFVTMQFEAQDRHYRQFCADEEFQIMLVDDGPVGRVIVHRDEGMITLVDLAVLPAYRGRGIAGRVLDDIVRAAVQSGLPVRCHVDPLSPARRLYERVGFIVQGQDGHLLAMEYPCATLPR